MEDEAKNDQANEPGANYSTVNHNHVRVFNSFEEANEAQRAYWASLTPEELFANLRKLIIASYGLTSEIDTSAAAKRITIREYREH
jgi:hypothetical protein